MKMFVVNILKGIMVVIMFNGGWYWFVNKGKMMKFDLFLFFVLENGYRNFFIWRSYIGFL